LRIYEGATEVQKIVIARELLKRRATQSSLAAE
jgi:alkylation response protein AidB-like acyl-CoA dehydrogenase